MATTRELLDERFENNIKIGREILDLITSTIDTILVTEGSNEPASKIETIIDDLKLFIPLYSFIRDYRLKETLKYVPEGMVPPNENGFVEHLKSLKENGFRGQMPIGPFGGPMGGGMPMMQPPIARQVSGISTELSFLSMATHNLFGIVSDLYNVISMQLSIEYEEDRIYKQPAYEMQYESSTNAFITSIEHLMVMVSGARDDDGGSTNCDTIIDILESNSL